MRSGGKQGANILGQGARGEFRGNAMRARAGHIRKNGQENRARTSASGRGVEQTWRKRPSRPRLFVRLSRGTLRRGAALKTRQPRLEWRRAQWEHERSAPAEPFSRCLLDPAAGCGGSRAILLTRFPPRPRGAPARARTGPHASVSRRSSRALGSTELSRCAHTTRPAATRTSPKGRRKAGISKHSG